MIHIFIAKIRKSFVLKHQIIFIVNILKDFFQSFKM